MVQIPGQQLTASYRDASRGTMVAIDGGCVAVKWRALSPFCIYESNRVVFGNGLPWRVGRKCDHRIASSDVLQADAVGGLAEVVLHDRRHGGGFGAHSAAPVGIGQFCGAEVSPLRNGDHGGHAVVGAEDGVAGVAVEIGDVDQFVEVAGSRAAAGCGQQLVGAYGADSRHGAAAASGRLVDRGQEGVECGERLFFGDPVARRFRWRRFGGFGRAGA